MLNVAGSNSENYKDGKHRPHTHAYFSQELLKRIEHQRQATKLKPMIATQAPASLKTADSVQATQAAASTKSTLTTYTLTKYRTSSLSESDINSLSNRLTTHLEQQKPYLDLRFTLIDLALALNVANHHLSQVINIGLNSNFNRLINRYRIKESMRLIEQDTAARSNITRIQFDSGFGSKSVFHRVFKQHMGITPKSYWEQCRAHKRVLALPLAQGNTVVTGNIL